MTAHPIEQGFPVRKFRVRKEGLRWMVYVPANVVASIPFVAPFSTFERAIAYVRQAIERAQR